MDEPVAEPVTETRRRPRRLVGQAEESWLNRLADEAASEGTAGSVSFEEMAVMLHERNV
ncbi:hypothetical protein AB0D67_29720 [Streptosporangium sp. NPDC048047]|uniref:hypothetical protein n=1 Tax=Streptosporangium sp. NPDC048047 TaxID=3155748 RepID=UPI00341B744C